ncbi:hypothetical protein CGCS363_v011855 [Colletotrichum siamense]|uniref:uncharacterized protein n=1 Tax=Colletotrichum siamense TaxID=690259 RepID=UPI0018725DB0|nr:uncharacterized protein CGCS363_v011855 [Colletotrichum siamense]KAF5489430.1 hypothetical protein CGCS363_v011855 [Colletotrichum siamense]
MSSRQTQIVNENDVQAHAGSWCGTQHEQNARTHQSGQYDRNTAAFVDDRKREEENRQRLHDREGRRAHKNELKDKIDGLLLPMNGSSHKDTSSRNNDESKKKKNR